MIRRLGIFAFALSLAWSCSDDEEAPPKPAPRPDAGEGGDGGRPTGGRSGTGGSMGGMSGAAGAGGADGGEPSTGGVGAIGGDPGDGGMPGDGGIVIPPCPSDDVLEPPAELTTVCDPLAVWGPAMEVPANAGSPPQFLSVTPDELTIASASQTLMGTLFTVSERAATTEPFTEGQYLPLRGYVTLSPDGLRLIGLAEGQASYFEITRTLRDGVFGEPVPGPFTAINADAEANGLTFSGGALSADDRTFFYLAFDDGPNTDPLRVSVRTGSEPWPVGVPIVACEFKGYGGTLVRTPTGVSADALTLFFFDGARGLERAAFRPTVDDPFVFFTNLADRNLAQPNTACDRLYFGSALRYSEATP